MTLVILFKNTYNIVIQENAPTITYQWVKYEFEQVIRKFEDISQDNIELWPAYNHILITVEQVMYLYIYIHKYSRNFKC